MELLKGGDSEKLGRTSIVERLLLTLGAPHLPRKLTRARIKLHPVMNNPTAQAHRKNVIHFSKQGRAFRRFWVKEPPPFRKPFCGNVLPLSQHAPRGIQHLFVGFHYFCLTRLLSWGVHSPIPYHRGGIVTRTHRKHKNLPIPVFSLGVSGPIAMFPP